MTISSTSYNNIVPGFSGKLDIYAPICYNVIMSKQRFNLLANPELLQAVKIQAIKERRRYNEVIENAIQDYLNKVEGEKQTNGINK